MRAAIYWAPPPDDPLWLAGSAWLGRDAETGALCVQPPVPHIDALTAAPGRYGFHATLRPPMRLATSWKAFCGTVESVACATRPFVLPPLELSMIGGFLALRAIAPCPPMQALCDSCVLETDAHRAPASPAELARRRAGGLSARQEALLVQHGYPFVLDEWFFHMTLTRRLTAAEQPAALWHAERHFAGLLGASRLIEEICIFAQGTGDFLIAERFALGGGT